MDNTQKLGTGKISVLLAQLAIPAVIAQIINLLYNIIDRIYIGHIPEIGSIALTGVGLFMPMLMLINAFAMLVGAGGAPLVAIAMGKKEHEKAEKTVNNCFALLLWIALVLTIVFYIASPNLLRLFGASKDTLPYALSYSRIYILGSVFVLIVMGMNPFITTQGFAKISMMTTVIGAVINIILDPVFIFLFHMGASGAALATVISQSVGAVWILRFLTGKKTILHLKKEYMRIEKKLILPCLSLGISSFVMLSTESILSISFTSSLAKYGGDIFVGAMTIITSISQLITMPLQGICQGGQPIISFNYGAGNKERVKKAFYTQFLVCVVFTACFWSIMMWIPQFFVRMFTPNEALIRSTVWAIRIYMAVIFTMGFQMCCQQSFVALGKAKISLFLACLRKIFLLIPLIYLLPLLLQDKVFAVFVAEPVSDLIAATVTTVTFLFSFRKMMKE